MRRIAPPVAAYLGVPFISGDLPALDIAAR